MSISATQRLSQLPEVFSLNQLCRSQNWDKDEAKVYLMEWKKKDHIEYAGPRAGLYYNKVQSRIVTGDMRVHALLRKYPSAILMGESVLHNSGWTTQIPQEISVVVISRPTLAKIDGFSIAPRPRRWYKEFQSSFCRPEDVEFATYGLRALPPHLALLDLYQSAHKGTWKPDIDDLDLDDEHVELLNLLEPKHKNQLPEIFSQLDGFSPHPSKKLKV